jgi:hypothetical protein
VVGAGASAGCAHERDAVKEIRGGGEGNKTRRDATRRWREMRWQVLSRDRGGELEMGELVWMGRMDRERLGSMSSRGGCLLLAIQARDERGDLRNR